MRPGDTVAGRFELVEEIAEGATGTVFRARDLESGGSAAVKVLRLGSAVDSERFAREGAVLARQRHPGIVRYLAHGVVAAQRGFLAMEWLEGETLAARLLRGRLAMTDILALGLRLAEILGYLSLQGLVHRDVKPSNLFLVGGAPGATKLLDFGIVRRVLVGETLTQNGSVVGTPGYMAPEQAAGDGVVDARADLFALGCVLYECVAGVAPFRGENLMAARAKILWDEPPALAEVAGAPAALGDLVARLLAKAPAGRPASAVAVAASLAAMPPAEPPGKRPSGITTAELRLVSVVVAAGELRGDWDLAALAAKHGARAERFAADTVLVYLPGLGAAGDDAARAARLALELARHMPGARVVLSTGRGMAFGRAPVGEAIDRGVRALATAPPGGIRLDETTAGLVGARFTVGGDGGGLLLVGEEDELGGRRTLLGRATPCVGRERELAALEGTYDESATTPCARAVLVTGAAGAGKSRLREELLMRLLSRSPPPELLAAGASAARSGTPLGLVAKAIARVVGIQDGEPSEVRGRKLRARLSRWFAGDELLRVCGFLGELVRAEVQGGDIPSLVAARRDPRLMADGVRAAFEDWLYAESGERPVVLVLEDLQWADPATVRFVDGALRRLRDRPFLVLALARPEVMDAFPGLWAARALQVQPLAELGRRAALELARGVLGDKLDAAEADALVERAGGNAFCLEELIRWTAAGRGAGFPETVLGAAQARLDALGAEAKRLLRAASVFGRSFWAGGVHALLGGEAERAAILDGLRALVDEEVLCRRERSAFRGEVELAFRHGLLAEAAYASLTEDDRALGHRLAGAWLVAAGETDAGALARHLDLGGDVVGALAWYRRAAAEALDGGSPRDAIQLAEHAIRCGAVGAERGELRLIAAEAARWVGDTASSERHAAEAVALLTEGSAAWLGALSTRISAAVRLGNAVAVGSWIEQLLVVPEAVVFDAWVSAVALVGGGLLLAGDERATSVEAALERVAPEPDGLSPLATGRVRQLRAMSAMMRGEPESTVANYEAALAAFERVGDVRLAASARVNLGGHCLELGEFERAERVLRQALEPADQRGLDDVAALAQAYLGRVLSQKGRATEARGFAEAAVARFQTFGDRRFLGGSRMYLAGVARRGGDLATAEREARLAATLLSDAAPLRACALGELAAVLLARGAADEALAVATEAFALLESQRAIEEGDALVRLVRAEALRAVGRVEEARAAIRAASARIDERAARIADPRLREGFLERVPDNAATRALAAAWREMV